MPDIVRPYNITITGDNDAEINLYGEVVDHRPVDFWTGEPSREISSSWTHSSRTWTSSRARTTSRCILTASAATSTPASPYITG